jgi:hypothetical protein
VGAVQDIVAQLLAPKEQAGPTMGYGDVGGAMPEAYADPNRGVGAGIAHAIGSIASLPRRAIENSQQSLDSGNYNPGPALEAAMLPMGTGAIAGVPVRAGEAVLGSGAVRGVMSGMPETIVAPAIHYDGNVYSGMNHAHALDMLAQGMGTSPEAILNSGKLKDVEGFLTSRGRYVDRQEGARIADSAEQTPHEPDPGRELLAEDLSPDAEHYSPHTRKLIQGRP